MSGNNCSSWRRGSGKRFKRSRQSIGEKGIKMRKGVGSERKRRSGRGGWRERKDGCF